MITDVGSVKQPVLEAWRQRHPRFVASHPMAGTAQAGVEAGADGICSAAALGSRLLMRRQIPLPWLRFVISPKRWVAIG